VGKDSRAMTISFVPVERRYFWKSHPTAFQFVSYGQWTQLFRRNTVDYRSRRLWWKHRQTKQVDEIEKSSANKMMIGTFLIEKSTKQLVLQPMPWALLVVQQSTGRDRQTLWHRYPTTTTPPPKRKPGKLIAAALVTIHNIVGGVIIPKHTISEKKKRQLSISKHQRNIFISQQ
jgi:hypothetical protein